MEYHLAFCINQHFEPIARVMVASLRESWPKEKNLHIHCILESDFCTKKLQNTFPESKWNFVQFTCPAELPVHFHLSKHVYTRLWLSHLLPAVDRVLYVDADILFLNDPSAIFGFNLFGQAAAAVPDTFDKMGNAFHQFEESGVSFDPSATHFNSGVVLFDLAALRSSGFTDKALSLATTHPKALRLADQSVLNLVLEKKILLVPDEWNFHLPHVNFRSGKWKDASVRYPANLPTPRIVHFTTEEKPWLVDCNHPYTEEWKKIWDFEKIEEKEHEYHFAFVADKEYFEGLYVAVLSLVRNFSIAKPLQVWVIDRGLSDSQKDRLKKSWCRFRLELHLSFIHHTAMDIDHLPAGLHFNSAVYSRLMLHRYLPQQLERVVYLDSDILVTGDLSKLYDIDIKDCPIAATRDRSNDFSSPLHQLSDYISLFSIAPTDKYYNSGVLVIDLVAWRSNQYGEKAVQLAKDNPGILHLPDQNILNILLHKKIHEFSFQYNHQFLYYRIRSGEWKLPYFEGDKDTPIAVHFVGEIKPWHTNHVLPEHELWHREKAFLTFLTDR